MNKLELQMVNLLKRLKQNSYVCGIKAEFEAEGTRIEEAMRLKDVCAAAGLGLTIKIGGCEAIKDMLDAISLGAERIIAPMVETPYALKKFIQAAKMIYRENIRQIELLVNIETKTAFENFDEMLTLPEIRDLNGVVIGRVDYVGSMGWSRESINHEKVLSAALMLAHKAKQHDLKVIVGGGVSADSLEFFRAFQASHLDRFETRKVIFQCPGALQNNEEAFIQAVEFELMWLKNKRNYYRAIAHEDNERINMMEERYARGITQVREGF